MRFKNNQLQGAMLEAPFSLTDCAPDLAAEHLPGTIEVGIRMSISRRDFSAAVPAKRASQGTAQASSC